MSETGQQWLSFIDPKGLRNMNISDPKLQLYEEVKVLEKQLNDPKLKLNAFIISQTHQNDLINNNLSQTELENRNVLFTDNSDRYLPKLFEKILSTNVEQAQLTYMSFETNCFARRCQYYFLFKNITCFALPDFL